MLQKNTQMEQEGDTLTMPPFWTVDHRNRRRLRRSYSVLLTSTSLLVLFLVIALVFTLIVVPTLHCFASNILRPRTVKNSWESLNLVLVLFAIVCGFLSKNNTSETQTPRSHYHSHRSFSNPSTPPPWYEYSCSDRSFNRLSSFNSYPDLRQQIATDERCRFYDDTHLLWHRQPRPEAEEEEEICIENVTTALPQPRTKAVRRNVKRTCHAETIEKQETNDLVAKNSQPPSSPPPQTNAVRRNAERTNQKEPIEKPERNDLVVRSSQPPPPPPLPAERETVQGKKKRGIATKEFLTSLRGKKKKQRQRSVESFDSILYSEPFPLAPQPSPSLSQPPSVLQNLFSSKKGKHKKRHFVSVATRSISNKREHSSYRLEDNVMITANESPLIPIPPPPPPPPFMLPAWKFRVQGDFVRIDSIGSSRSGSPDLDEINVDSPTTSAQDETSQCNSPSAPDVEDPATVTAALLFCPSPDVDTKAHNFIESFRAGLRMAKMNSMKEKQGIGRSNLGPSPKPQTIK